MKKGVIFSSVFVLVLCACVMTGGTYALFTSVDNSNIAIVAGNIEVEAYLSNLKTSTLGTDQAPGSFQLGGTAVYNAKDNVLTLDKVAPGDKVTLDINIDNGSNLPVKYRVRVSFSGELQPALVATILLPGDDTATTLKAGTAVTDWVEFSADVDSFPISIELPATAGNDYRNKSAEIVITVEAVQANGTDLVTDSDFN